MLTFEKISHAFDEKIVLNDLNLVISPHLTNVLIGPSGCGKSTILRIAMGLIVPDHGAVSFGQDLLSRENIRRMRGKIGYVIQDGGLFPHLTALSNILLLPRFLHWGEERMQERIRELLDLTHFPEDGLSRFPSHLSGGQKQRVGLMRALFIDPEILLLDEALAALDPIVRSDLQKELKEIFKKLKKTVVWVTHDMGEAAFMGERIILMKEGRIVQIGSLKEFVNEPAETFVSTFINAQRSPLSMAVETRDE